MTTRTKPSLVTIARWTLAVTTLALTTVMIAFYVRFSTPLPACGKDVARHAALPNSPWVLEQTFSSCSATDIHQVQIVARKADTTIVLAELGELTDVDFTPLGANHVAITMRDPDDSDLAFRLFRAEPKCAADDLTVEYRFVSGQESRSSQRRYSCVEQFTR